MQTFHQTNFYVVFLNLFKGAMVVGSCLTIRRFPCYCKKQKRYFQYVVCVCEVPKVSAKFRRNISQDSIFVL